MRFLTGSRNWVGLVLLIITFACLKERASAQTGFLSLDCGAPGPYVDNKGISWVPDDTYISSGETGTIDLATWPNTAAAPDFKEVRYFPDVTRSRYCYSLPTTVGQTYFIRATHFHGGYDNKPDVKFDVGLDVYSTRVTGALNGAATFSLVMEGFFRAYKDSTQYCMYRLPAGGNPFISSLELRPLDSTMYAKVADGSALLLQTRANFGFSKIIRYPDDPYDRYWFYAEMTGVTNVTSTGVVDTGFALERPPPAVMNTAVSTTGRYISYVVTPVFHDDSFIINVYLAELDPLLGSSRSFDILINDVVVSPNVNIYTDAVNKNYSPIQYSFNNSQVNTNSQLNVTLSRKGLSTAPSPLWNAVEYLSVHKKLLGTSAADVGAIEGVKKAFGLGAMWVGDPCLLNPYDWLSCSADASPRVTAVNLSSANLSGQIPDMRALTSLTTLHLDNNQLTGPVPDWLATLPNLKELHLQNNSLTGSVPKALLSRPGLSLRVEGNPGLCANVTCSSDKGSKSKVGLIVGVVVGVLVVVGIAVAVIVMLCCRRRHPTDNIRRHPTDNMGRNPFVPPFSETVMEDGTTTRGSRYTLAQVMTATNRNVKLLGKGGFGPVYYGKLASGQEVAVKVAAKGSNQGSKEFINEIELLTRVHHKNLVSLVGYCDEGDNLILLYEYMSKGTVQEHLYGVGGRERDLFLDWKTRLQVALNAAQGLEYLHVGCQPVIFHRDVKSNNILLNDKLVAKVADFGLSKSGESRDNVTHMSTMVKGTIGYLDPEYYMTNQLTDKSDVYGFGIFLLELVCARPPFIQQLPEDQRRIDQWVRPYLENDTIEEIVDPALRGQYNQEAMWKVADLAMQSVEPKGKHRPNMSTVVQELRSAVAIENNESSSSIAPQAPSARGQEHAPAFRFDIPHSENVISDPQFGANPAINAR